MDNNANKMFLINRYCPTTTIKPASLLHHHRKRKEEDKNEKKLICRQVGASVIQKKKSKLF